MRVTDATFDQKVAEEILSLHTETSYDAIIGSTLGTQDFYEGNSHSDIPTIKTCKTIVLVYDSEPVLCTGYISRQKLQLYLWVFLL